MADFGWLNFLAIGKTTEFAFAEYSIYCKTRKAPTTYW